VRGASLGRVEIACQLEHCGLIELRLAMRIAAGREDEERTAHRGIALIVGKLDCLAGEVREDDGFDRCD